MKVIKFFVVFIFVVQSALFGVSTSYLSSSDFRDLSAFSMSNVSLVDTKGFRLARRHSRIYSSGNVIWSMAFAGNKILISTGDKASLLLFDGKKAVPVYSQSNKIMFTDIKSTKGGWLLSSLPAATVTFLDKNYKEVRSWSRTNKYAWDIIPSGKGFYLLCGKPAELYYAEGKKIKSLASFENEENLMSGELVRGTLYFSGEHYIYKWDGQKSVAIAHFNNSIGGFVNRDGMIYVVTATREKKVYSGNGSSRSGGNPRNKNRPSFQESRLWELSGNGRKKILLESKNAKFLSVSLLGNSVLVGTDKDGGYYEYNLMNGEKSFSALGEGKVLHLFSFNNSVHAVTVYPSSIIKIDKSFAKRGILTSIPYDTGNISRWGKLFIKKKLFPETTMTVFTRSGLVADRSLWEGWKEAKNEVSSATGRYFQYRVVLEGDGSHTPLFRKLTVPYVQKNIAPEISDFKIDYDHSQIKFSWDSKDANHDPLSFTIYIASVGGPWVKLTNTPQKGNDFSLNRIDFPSGRYRVKLIVSDAWANSDAKNAMFTSDSFYIDNDPPKIGSLSLKKEGKQYRLRFTVTDGLLPIMMAAYTLNGKDWTQISPVDGIFDSKSESFDLPITVKQAGFLQIHTQDVMGNVSVRGVFVK